MWLWTKVVFESEDSSGMEEFSTRRNVTSRRLDMTEAPGWILGVMNMMGKALGNLDKCHHLDANQILITTNAPHFPTCRSLRKKSRRSKDTRGGCRWTTTFRGFFDEKIFAASASDAC